MSRPVKKSSNLEIRLTHAKKEAFMAACVENDVSASHVLRTFIDAYLQQSRQVKLKRIAKDIAMTFIHNPVKTTLGIGSMFCGGIVAAGLLAAPGMTQIYLEPLEPPVPVYPADMADEGLGAKCEVTFTVSAEGTVEKDVIANCTHLGFDDSAISAVLQLTYEPTLKNGQPTRVENVVYPLEYMIEYTGSD